jgi:hypothetical protein
MVTYTEVQRIRKKFDINSPKLCEYTNSGVTYNDSENVRDVYYFLNNRQIFDEIVGYAPIADEAKSFSNISSVIFFCVGGTICSTYVDPPINVIKFATHSYLTPQARSHVYLHEFMHALTVQECPEIIGVSLNTSAHCRVFKRGLLYADYLYGILSADQFSRLEPMVDTFEPNKPYAFEHSYERQYLIPTTRHSYERSGSSSIDQSNKNPNNIKKRLTNVLYTPINADTCIYTPTLDLIVQIDESCNTPEDVADFVCTQLENAELTSVFDSSFLNKINKRIFSEYDVIYQTINHPQSVKLKLALDPSLLDCVELKALFFKDVFGEALPILTQRSILEAEFKYKNALPKLFDDDQTRDIVELAPTSYKGGGVECQNVGTRLKTIIADKIVNKEIFDFDILYQARTFISPQRLAFDGYFMQTPVVYFSNRQAAKDKELSICFTDDLKTEYFTFDITSFVSAFTFDLADIEYVVERFTHNMMGAKLKDSRLVNVFDTDTLFTNILALIRNESEVQAYSTQAKLSSTAQFSSVQEYRDWQTQVPMEPLCIVSPHKTYPSKKYRTDDNILTGIKEYFLTDDFEILGQPIQNRIKGFRQSILSDSSFDVSFIAKYIQKGVPFVFAYADSKLALQEDMIFLYFDGQKLAVFEGAKLNSQDMFDLNVVSRLMQQSDLFAIDYLDFGQATLPRPNYAKTAIADDVQALLNNPVATFGDDLIVNLFEVPTNVYANDIVGSLVFRPNLLLKSVIGKKEQMIAVEDKGILRFVYVDKIGRASILDSVYAWWLLAL